VTPNEPVLRSHREDGEPRPKGRGQDDMPKRHPVVSPGGFARRSTMTDPEDQATSPLSASPLQAAAAFPGWSVGQLDNHRGTRCVHGCTVGAAASTITDSRCRPESPRRLDLDGRSAAATPAGPKPRSTCAVRHPANRVNSGRRAGGVAWFVATCRPGLSGRSVSGEVPGGSLFLWLPVSLFERGSFMACGLAGRRGEAWLIRGLPCS
jgi:hypothetical protein